MAESVSPRRLTDVFPAKAASCLLFLMWIAGMSMFDSNACSSFPLVCAMGMVALLVLSAMSFGGRAVRLSHLNWTALAVGGYFMVRCANSYATAESLVDSVLILCGVLFYVAGIYAAHARGIGKTVFCLGVAVGLNIVAFFLFREHLIPMEWTGRPRYGFSGENAVPVTLFVYKNFAAAFLCWGGVCLLGCALWCAFGRCLRLFLVLSALGSMALSFCCGARDVYVMLPLLLAFLWCMHVVNTLYRNEKTGGLTWLCGAVLFVGGSILVYEFLFSGEAYKTLMSTDTHLRSLIWLNICHEAPAAPLWGFGAGASHWGIVHRFGEWATPNYAHNEYLQAWMDYGILGVSGTVLLLVSHSVTAFRQLASEHISAERRVLVSLSLLTIVAWAVCAVADFPWHHFSLVAVTAFALGIAASPYPHTKKSFFSRRRWADNEVLPVRVQGHWGRGVLALLCVASAVYAGFLGTRLCRAWGAQWEYSAMFRTDGDDATRRLDLLGNLLPEYPDSALMDQYYRFPLKISDRPRQEKLLNIVLAANPRQLYAVTMLADVLTREGRYEESERLLREKYVGDGMPFRCVMNWPSFYTANLLLWGRDELRKGHAAKAYSLLDYALNICSHPGYGLGFRLAYRGNAPWCVSRTYKSWVQDLRKSAESDCRLLRMLGIEKDDSWMLPPASGGKPALYAVQGKDASLRKKK